MIIWKMMNLFKEDERITKVFGPPGTGKTTWILNKVEELLEKGIKPDRIALVSFTNKAVEEFVDRALLKFCKYTREDFPWFRTIHSLCNKCGDGRKILSQTDLYKFAKTLGLDVSSYNSIEDNIGCKSGDKLIQIENLARLKKQSLEKTFSEYDTDFNYEALLFWKKEYEKFKKERNIVDFTDLLQNFDYSLEVDYFFVDEAQDLSTLQWGVIEKASKLAKEIYIAGDDDQCQPAGELVLTSSGYKQIELLNPDKDKLVFMKTHTQGGYKFKGHNKKEGSSFEISKKEYEGKLFCIGCKEEKHRYTPNHLCYFKMKLDKDNNYCLYLMRKGDNFRIGQTRLRNKCGMNGQSGFSSRLLEEKGDSLWLLDVNKNKNYINFQEKLIAYQYGIPQTLFSDSIAKDLFSSIDTKKRAAKLLIDKELLIDFPLIDKKTWKSGGGLNVTASCNLNPQIMKLPIYQKGKDCHPYYLDFTLNKEDYKGFVYSLNVYNYHNYINGTIVTHNCIYKFAGSDTNYFLDIYDKKDIVLSKSYRLPFKIFEKSKEILKDISIRKEKKYEPDPKNGKGEIEYIGSLNDINFNDKETYLILFRNRWLAKDVCEDLRNLNLPFLVFGKNSLGEDLIKAIILFNEWKKEKQASKNVINLLSKFCSSVRGEIPLDLINLKWFEAFDLLDFFEKEYIKECFKKGYNLLENPKIKISTIHSAKGGEADNIILFLDVSATVYDNIESEDEKKVWYVAITRAKKKLFIVNPQSLRYYNL